MTVVAILCVTMRLVAVTPLQSDTPPAPPIPVNQLSQLKSMQDVIGVTLLTDGSRAPADLSLPELLNRQQVLEFMRTQYPEEMVKVNATSVPIAWMMVNTDGSVGAARLLTSTGYLPLDSLALAALRVASFKPARRADRDVAVWVPFPANVPPYSELTAMLTATEPAEAPTEIEYTQKPVLLNRNQIEAAIIRVVHSANPKVRAMDEMFARSQRIGGTAEMQVYIDEGGAVSKARMKKTSGHPDLDAAAHNIVKMMRFSPAKNGDKPVGVWIEVPIRFKAN